MCNRSVTQDPQALAEILTPAFISDFLFPLDVKLHQQLLQGKKIPFPPTDASQQIQANIIANMNISISFFYGGRS